MTLASKLLTVIMFPFLMMGIIAVILSILSQPAIDTLLLATGVMAVTMKFLEHETMDR